MKLQQALTRAGEKLAALKDIDAPTFEAEVLLRYSLQISRAEFYLKLKDELPAAPAARFNGWLERRLQGEPTAYIIGQREFFGLDFYVDRRVLIPRPESELLVEAALEFIRSHPVRSVADIGTGSGAIAVSLAVNLSRLLAGGAAGIAIYAVDLSEGALAVARLNARRQAVEDRITFRQGDLLSPLSQPVDVLIANLPYVSAAEVKSMPSARFEPVLALDGGESGLDLLFRLAERIEGRLNQGGCVLLEIGMGQAKAVTARLETHLPGAHIEVLPDLAGIERVVKVIRYSDIKGQTKK